MSRKPIDFRAIIRAELDRRGRGSRTALAKYCGERYESLARYLSGRQDATGKRIAAYLHALKLQVSITPKSKPGDPMAQYGQPWGLPIPDLSLHMERL